MLPVRNTSSPRSPHRGGTGAAPLEQPLPFSLRTALLLVLAVWSVVSLLLGYRHLFYVQQPRIHHAAVVHTLARRPDLRAEHVAELITNAAQGADVLSFSEHGYALFFIANYYGSSMLVFFRPTAEQTTQVLVELPTKCGHSWTAWQHENMYAAVANYCGAEGVVVYQLEAVDPTGPEYVFRQQLKLPGGGAAAGSAAANGSSSGSSAVLHVVLPDGGHLLAVAEYGYGTVAVHELRYDDDGAGVAGGKGLQSTEAQRLAVPGVSALASCMWVPPTGVAGARTFLVAAAYNHNGWSTESVIFAWDAKAKQFKHLQALATQGAHGAACFPLGDTLALAIANARGEDGYNVNSTVYRYSPDANRFLPLQAVPTVGAHAVAHVSVGPSDLLLFANRGVGEECKAEQTSPVLMWDGKAQRFEPVAHLTAPCATGLAAASLGGEEYVLLTSDRNSTGSYVTGTSVWRLSAQVKT